MMKFTAAALVVCLAAACDTVAPNRAASESFTTASGLRVEMRVEPASINPVGAFTVTISARNTLPQDLRVTAPVYGTSGSTAVAHLGALKFTKDGQPAQAIFQTNSGRCLIKGTEVESQTEKLLKTNEEVSYYGEPCRLDFIALPAAHAGEYQLTYTFAPRIGPTEEEIPSISMKFRIRD